MAGDKYLYNASGTITEKAAVQTSAGAGDAGKIPALDGGGKLDVTMMPAGIAADTALVEASENLAAGDLVNIFNSSGAKVRKADATTAGKRAHGFVIASVTSGQNATVYFEGTNSSVTGLTPGEQYLSTTAGTATATAPSGAGNVVQRVGFATAAAALNFQAGEPITLA
jgi:hypothetical protein